MPLPKPPDEGCVCQFAGGTPGRTGWAWRSPWATPFVPQGVPHRALLIAVLILLASAGRSDAQAWYGGARWEVRRSVTLPDAPGAGEVCVAEFLTTGFLTDEQPGVIVVAGRDEVPSRVLQRGPGDQVRVAFLTVANEPHYDIYYGGAATEETWPDAPGLLLDVRAFVDCDVAQLDSVRDAFERAPPLGRDYVDQVYLGLLPFADSATPVLAVYSGTLTIEQPGAYKFFTTSQDASWLLIDGKPVVSWPGRHRPVGDARHVGEVTLSAGPHQFEYVYATPDAGYVAVAAWQPSGGGAVEPIPAAAFGAVRRVDVDRPRLRSGGPLADFRAMSVAQAVVTAESPPLVRMRFSVRGSSRPARWAFGDGQTALGTDVEHVYLVPGEYTVDCETAGARSVPCRIVVSPPWPHLNEEEANADIADWQAELQKYDVGLLSAAALRQLVRIYVELENPGQAIEAGVAGFRQRPRDATPLEPDAAAQLVADLAELIADEPSRLDEALLLCREGLAVNPSGAAALRLWLLTANLALSLDRPQECGDALATIRGLVDQQTPAVDRVRVSLLAGDLARRTGDDEAAHDAYEAAQSQSLSQNWDLRERIARGGSFSRTIEDQLRSGDVQRADATLAEWALQIPLSRVSGDAALLRTRCLLNRGFLRQAVLECGDFLRVAADDPYADRILLLAATAQHRLGDDVRANTTLQQLLTDYPGSAFVPDARRWLAEGFPPPEDDDSSNGPSPGDQ